MPTASASQRRWQGNNRQARWQDKSLLSPTFVLTRVNRVSTRALCVPRAQCVLSCQPAHFSERVGLKSNDLEAVGCTQPCGHAKRSSYYGWSPRTLVISWDSIRGCIGASCSLPAAVMMNQSVVAASGRRSKEVRRARKQGSPSARKAGEAGSNMSAATGGKAVVLRLKY